MDAKQIKACDRVINSITKLRNQQLDLSVPYLKVIDKKLKEIQKEMTEEKLKNYNV